VPGLSIIAFGHVHAEDVMALSEQFVPIEILALDVPPRDAIAAHRAEFHRAVDAAANDWLLIVREREKVDAPLAREIGEAANGGKARGFRIRAVPHYAGKPLRVGAVDGGGAGDAGEVRLFHRRNFLRFANKGEWSEVTVQGSVIRLHESLRSVTFASSEEHRQYLAESGVPHSTLRRLLIFVHHLAVTRARDRNTWRYLWIEAGYDHA
jgi:hypothetical protein